jgi:tetratricopeptide (TPR) repeat protein
LAAFALYGVWLGEPTPERRTTFEESLIPLDEIDPENPYGMFFRAMLVEEGDNRPEEAISRYTRILTRGDLSVPFRAWLLRNRADAARKVEDIESATKDIEEAVRLDPLHPANYMVLSRILANTGALGEAAIRARQAISLRPSVPWSQFLLGWIQYQRGEIHDAAKILGEACQVHRMQRICGLYAASLQRMGRDADALEAAQEASELVNEGKGSIELARFWMLRGDSDLALRYLRLSAQAQIVESESSIDSFDGADFLPLHGNPEFEAIVAEVKKRIGEE